MCGTVSRGRLASQPTAETGGLPETREVVPHIVNGIERLVIVIETYERRNAKPEGSDCGLRSGMMNQAQFVAL